MQLKLTLLTILLWCGSLLGQSILRNNLDTNNVAPAGGNGYLLESIGGIPVWTATITAQVENWWDTAAHIDTNVWPLGTLTYAYDGDRTDIGDGSTLGGLPVGFRTWQTPTNALTAGGRAGEHAFSLAGFNHLSTAPAALPPILWVNSAKGTNWIPLIAFQKTSPPSLISETLLTTAFFSLDAATNGAFFDAFAISSGGGNAGNIVNAVNLAAGAGGNAFDTSDSSIGGPGGDINSAFLIKGGHGGNATGAGGAGGAGGSVSQALQFQGGNGGDDAFGNGGGAGGSAGQFFSNGGNGANATVSSAGGNGGNGGGISSLGGNAIGTTNGGSGGVVTTDASTIYSGGSFATKATATRDGGNLTTFASSYAPATLFTTTTSAGLVSSASGSVLGTAAFLAGPNNLANTGKVIGSNVIDHVGRTLHVEAWGYILTNGTPTFSLSLTLGGTTVVGTGSQTLSSVTTTQEWHFVADVPFRTTGGSGTTFGQGKFEYGTSATAQQTIWALQTATSTIDTTKDETIDLTATMTTGSGNIFICTWASGTLIN